MIPRINTITTQSAEGLHIAQEKLNDLIQTSMAHYAKDLIFQPQVDFIRLEQPAMTETLKPSKALKRLTEGDKWLIPKATLNQIKGNAYVAVGSKLFFVEKARNKITAIDMTEDKLNELRNGELSLERIAEITGHVVEGIAIKTIESMDPVQIRLSKHALLALKESEELVRNIGKFSAEIVERLTKETSTVPEEEDLTPEAKEALLELQTEQLIAAIETTGTMEPEKSTASDDFLIDEAVKRATPAVELVQAGAQFVKEGGTMVINSAPLLKKGLQLLKPLQSTILLSIAASFSETAAVYQTFVNYSWYFDMARQAGRAVSSLRQFAIEKQDNLLRPLVALSSHCEEMYKIADQAKLPDEVKNELKNMRHALAEAQAKIWANPSGSIDLLKITLEDINGKISTLVETYFTENSKSIIEPANKQKNTKPSVAMRMTEHMKSLVDKLHTDTANLREDPTFKEAITQLESSLQKQDTDGFYIYLSDNQETALSLNLKAIANTFLAIEKLNHYYTSDSSETSRLKAIQYGKKAFENFNKINWKNVNQNASAADNEMMNSMLTQGMEIVASNLKHIVDATHQTELANHLRYGFILEEIHPLFKSLENVFHDRGLTIPDTLFGYDENREKELAQKRDLAIQAMEELGDQAAVENQLAVMTRVLERLDWYEKWANKIPKQGSMQREKGLWIKPRWSSEYEFDLPAAIEKNAILILKDLANLRVEKGFKGSTEGLEQLENRLITDLSNEKKLKLYYKLAKTNVYPELRTQIISSMSDDDKKALFQQLKSQTDDINKDLKKQLARHFTKKKDKDAAESSNKKSKGIVENLNALTAEFKERNADVPVDWPPKELTEVYKTILTARETLDHHLLDAVKYQEAIDEYEKTRLKSEETKLPVKKNNDAAVLEPVQSAPRINNAFTETTQAIREKLQTTIQHVFSDYANKNFLWDVANPSQVKPILASDPPSVKLAKNAMLAIQEAEKASNQITTLIDQINKSSLQWNSLTQAIQVAGSLFTLSEQLENITTLAKETGADDALFAKLAELKQTIKDLPVNVLNSPKEAESKLNKILNQLGSMVVDVIKPATRVAAPVLPENKYATAVQKESKYSVQENTEWFFPLEPLRVAKMQSEWLHKEVRKHIDMLQNKGISIDEKDAKEINDTAEALKEKPDSQGYYTYIEDETPFSQTLKALYNISWSINEISRGYFEHTGATAALTATNKARRHALLLLSHYNKLNLPGITKYAALIGNEAMNSFLMNVLNRVHSVAGLTELADSLHTTELNHHLRLGVLSTPFRSHTYELEKLYFSRGISGRPNLFTYDQSLEEKLRKNIKNVNADDAKKEQSKDALEEYKKIRCEFALEYLSREGINGLILAAKEGKVNIEKIRLLAIILADINLVSREDALSNPIEYVNLFIEKNNDAIRRGFIAQVKEMNPSLGNTLMLEAFVAGELDFNADDLNHLNYDNESLSHILDKLEAKQVLSLMDNNLDTNRKNLFISILKNDLLSQQDVDALKPDYNRNDLVPIIIARYSQLQAELKNRDSNTPEAVQNIKLMHSLGLMLARLAHANVEMAKNIFSDTIAKSIVQHESIKTDSSLYSEAKVNSFAYKPEEKNQKLDEFISKNASIILEIHHEMHPGSEKKDSNIIIHDLKRDPIAILNELDLYIKNKLSPGSGASDKMRQFASDFILCTDNTLRYEMLKLNIASEGSKYSRYLDLLTPEAGEKFWKKVKTDQYNDTPKKMLQQLDKRAQSLCNSLELLNENHKERLIAAFNTDYFRHRHKLQAIAGRKSGFFKSLTGSVAEASKLMVSKNDLLLAKRRFIAGEFVKIENDINDDFHKWEKKINALDPKNKDANSLESLQVYLDDIIAVLKSYEVIRPARADGFVASLFSIRADKQNMVKKYKDLFQGLNAAVKGADPNNKELYEEYAGHACMLYDKFEQEHKKLTGTFSSYRSGKLGDSLKKIGEIREGFHPDPKLDRTISSVGKIIARIRKLFGLGPIASPSSEGKKGP